VNSVVAFVILIATVTVAIVLTAVTPSLLSDQNSFLRGFVNHELVGFMGVVVTISLASASSLYLELGRIGRERSIDVSKPKKGVRFSALSLLIALSAAIAIVIVKPAALDSLYLQSAFNSFAVLVIVFSILILTDLVKAGFSIGDL
jgi:hypothetical protein